MRIQNILPAIAAFLLIMGVSLSAVFAQNYYLLQTEGIGSQYAGVAPGDEILGGSLGSFNEQMSAARTLPFAFNFYGTPVTQYRVSDNGYITFDVTNTNSVPVNTTLPDVSSPTNAIFAYWDDFELNTAAGMGTVDAIVSYTLGDPGSQVHVIQWRSVSRVGLPGNQNFVYFGIRLYENGPWDFDVIHQWTRPSATGLLSATIGCQDATGANGYMVAGSPSIDLPGPNVNNTPDVSGVAVYGFKYGTQPANDTYLSAFDVPELVKSGDNVTVSGKLSNLGSATINSLSIDYAVNGGTPMSFSPAISGGVASNASYTFSHTVPYIPGTAGQFEDLEMWVSQVNGGVDANPDSLPGQAFVNLGIPAKKRVLMEEFSTAPCQFCPDGAVFIDNIKAAFGESFIVAQHHAGFGTDAMTIPAHSDYAAAFAPGAPTATVDRVLFDGEDDVAISRGIWQASVNSRLTAPSPVEVDVQTYYNSSTSQLEIISTVEFIDYGFPGDLRFTVMITEGEVTGSGSGYDQVNAYNTQAGHPYAGAGNPIVGYAHKDVTRAVLTQTWGDPLGITATPAQTKTFTNTYFVPATSDWTKLSAVAFVSYFDNDVTKRQILNADAQPLQERGVGIDSDLVAEGFSASVFPVPSQGMTNLRVELGEQTSLQIDILDVMGKNVAPIAHDAFAPGEHDLTFNVDQLASGIYFVRFISEKGVATHKFVVGN